MTDRKQNTEQLIQIEEINFDKANEDLAAALSEGEIKPCRDFSAACRQLNIKQVFDCMTDPEKARQLPEQRFCNNQLGGGETGGVNIKNPIKPTARTGNGVDPVPGATRHYRFNPRA